MEEYLLRFKRRHPMFFLIFFALPPLQSNPSNCGNDKVVMPVNYTRIVYASMSVI